MQASAIQACDRCGAQWHYAWKCQIVCPNCGARQDCSDLFVDHARVRSIQATIEKRRKGNDDATRKSTTA